jgi:predicted esterase
MRNLLLILAVIASLSLNAQQVQKHLKASNGTQIGFLEYKPTDYSTSKPKYPLIIFLHGIGERGNGTTDLPRVSGVGIAKLIKNGNPMRFTYNGKTETFLVLSPQLSSSYGKWQPFYIDAMIEYAKANLNVDPNRIYLTGLSLGGGGVWGFSSETLEHASELAAIVPICGTCALSSPANVANGDVAVWAFHAQDDNRVSVTCTKNAIAAIKAKNPSIAPKMTIWPTGKHVIWDRVYDPSKGYVKGPNIYQWFLSHSRNGAVVTAKNKKPVANAGADISLNAGVTTAKLNGSASKDPDGQITSYTWRKVSGPASGIMSATSEQIAQLTSITLPGTYEYELKVVDDKGASAVDKVKVKVAKKQDEPNKKPRADAGENISITLPTSAATLSGTGSRDEDGKIASYKWTKVSGPTAFKIVNPASAITSITSLKAGKYIFRLTVADDSKATAFDDVQVIVKAAVKENIAPQARAGNDIHITLPVARAQLNGSASTDEDGSIVSYTWTKVGGPGSFKIIDGNKATATVQNLKEGTYTFRLTVKDNGKRASSDNVLVYVKRAAPVTSNRAPLVRAGESVTITLPTNKVALSGQGTRDPDGSISSYRWFVLSGPGGATIANSDEINTTITNLKEGRYIVRLEATDNSGKTSHDDKRIIVEPRNAAPVIDAGENITITLPQNRVILNGKGSRDPDGTIVSFHWRVLQGDNYSFQDSRRPVTSITGLREGKYVIRLEGTDNKGEVSYDDMALTVLPFNQKPIISAGDNIVLTLPVNKAVLNGKESRDPDGSIVSYKWRVLKGPAKYSLANADASSTLITNLVAGTYTLRLEAMDNRGAIGFDDVNVIVREGSATSASRQASDATANSVDEIVDSSVAISNLNHGQLTPGAVYGKIRTYPNPAVSTLTVEMPDSAVGKAVIHVYDMNGRIMKNLSTQKNQLLLREQIDVSNLPPGVYLLEINVNNISRLNSRFIKQ